jgi:hypothetical protein
MGENLEKAQGMDQASIDELGEAVARRLRYPNQTGTIADFDLDLDAVRRVDREPGFLSDFVAEFLLEHVGKDGLVYVDEVTEAAHQALDRMPARARAFRRKLFDLVLKAG